VYTLADLAACVGEHLLVVECALDILHLHAALHDDVEQRVFLDQNGFEG